MRTALAPLLLLLACIPASGQGGTDTRNWFGERQEADGRWSAGSPAGDESDSARSGEFDVGRTALVVFLHGSHPRWEPMVQPAIGWLLAQQDPATGRIGSEADLANLQHALATLAVCDRLYFGSRRAAGGDSEDAVESLLRKAAARAVAYIVNAAGAGGGWGGRAGAPADAFHTGWMLYALVAARDAGIEIDGDAFTDGLAWLARWTDPATGRVAFGAEGTPDPLGVSTTEIMTAEALLVRMLVTPSTQDDPLVALQAARLVAAPPVRGSDGPRADPTYWLFGSLALYRVGGKAWRAWSAGLRTCELVRRIDSMPLNSRGALGAVAGRVGEAALASLVAEVYFRYAAFTGAR